MLRYDKHARRLWVLGQRVHHGSVGCVVTVVGLILVVHDRKDIRHWFAPGDPQSALEKREDQSG